MTPKKAIHIIPQLHHRQLRAAASLSAGIALALAVGPTFAVDHTINATNNFTMLDPTGAVAGGSTDVSGTFDDTLICTDVSCTDLSMTLQSDQLFSGQPWTAHDIRTFSEGSYTFDTACTGADIAAGTTDCGGSAPLSLTVGTGQLGAHMLFDWGTNTDIDVAVVWNINDSFGSPIYDGGCQLSPPGENCDATQTPARDWNVASKDGNSDGIPGISMVDGPFQNFNANFNLDMEPPFSFGTPAVTTVNASILPGSRSVQIPNPATAFATIINAGTADATGCDIAPVTTVAATFSYQTTDPVTNAVTGTPDTPADIAAGGSQSYVFSFTPTADIPPTDVELAFDCTDTDPAPVIIGLNTFLLSASTNPVADIVALAATQSGNGIVELPGDTGSNAFAMATVNVGSLDTITASTDTGGVSLPVDLLICESNSATGDCLAAPAASVTTTIDANATPTFSVFVTGSGTVPFDPAVNRISVRLKDAADVIRGSTSVAVQTVTP